jgi:hypothetical protein
VRGMRQVVECLYNNHSAAVLWEGIVSVFTALVKAAVARSDRYEEAAIATRAHSISELV